MKTGMKLVSHEQGVDNLMSVWNRASGMERHDWVDYYPRFHDRLLRMGDPVVVGGVFVAVSPNNNEKSNWRDTENLLTAFRKHGRIGAEAVTVHSYGSNKRKAIRILEGEDPAKVFVAPKTYNFYHNVVFPFDPRYVTVDGHIVSAWQGKRLTMDQAGISHLEYNIIVDGMRVAAGTTGTIPCHFQSTIWNVWKRINRVLYDPQFKFEFCQ